MVWWPERECIHRCLDAARPVGQALSAAKVIIILETSKKKHKKTPKRLECFGEYQVKDRMPRVTPDMTILRRISINDQQRFHVIHKYPFIQ